jgi:hypothetical protein
MRKYLRQSSASTVQIGLACSVFGDSTRRLLAGIRFRGAGLSASFLTHD